MISKQKISLLRSLRLKKNIYEQKLFVIEGDKLLTEALKTNPDIINEIYILNELYTEWEFRLSKSNALIHRINSKELSQLSTLTTPAGIIAICHHFESKLDQDILKSTISLYLHEVRDPGNMGTIIRTADWFGIKNILCSLGSVDLYNSKVIQATMGSIFRTNIHYIEVEELIQLKSYVPFIATIMDGNNLFKQSKMSNGIIMLGSESHGLPDHLINMADLKLSIPKANNSKAESLNVAVAAGIFCSHLI
jgi:TrmH family RNA methyltransferase